MTDNEELSRHLVDELNRLAEESYDAMQASRASVADADEATRVAAFWRDKAWRVWPIMPLGTASEPRPDGARIAAAEGTPGYYLLCPQNPGQDAAGVVADLDNLRAIVTAMEQAARTVLSTAPWSTDLAAQAEEAAAGILRAALEPPPLTEAEEAAVRAVSASLDILLKHVAAREGIEGAATALMEWSRATPPAPLVRKRGRSDVTAFTAPPVVALQRALADGVTGRGKNFALVNNGGRMVHNRGKAGYQVAVDYADPVASVDEALREIGRSNGLEAVFTVAAGCYHALAHEGEPVHVDDNMADVGWQRNRDGAREDRAGARERIARLYLALNGWIVFGDTWGKFKDKDGTSLDVSSRGPLFTTTVLYDKQSSLLGPPAPVAFVFRCGEFLARNRERPQVLETFGTYRALAHMPRQRPSDAWAVAVGLALVQSWRERASYARPTTTTRRYLLSQYPPEPGPDEVLADKEHGARNAKAWWLQALKKLRLEGVIDADVERRLTGNPADLPRNGWGDAWLDEPLDGRPPASYEADFRALAEKAQTHKKRRRGRPKKAQ